MKDLKDQKGQKKNVPVNKNENFQTKLENARKEDKLHTLSLQKKEQNKTAEKAKKVDKVNSLYLQEKKQVKKPKVENEFNSPSPAPFTETEKVIPSVIESQPKKIEESQPKQTGGLPSTWDAPASSKDFKPPELNHPIVDNLGVSYIDTVREPKKISVQPYKNDEDVEFFDEFKDDVYDYVETNKSNKWFWIIAATVVALIAVGVLILV